MMMAMNATGSGMPMSMMERMHNTGDVSKINSTSSKSVKIVDTYETGPKNSLLLYNQSGSIVK